MTTPNIPRAEWRQHPRFETQALLLGSHANFRRISAHLVEHAEAEPARAQALYTLWKRAMASHEAYEERKLYPFLANRWGVSFAEAEAGHERLAERDADVRAAFASGVGVRHALTAHHEVLIAHLALEEELVIPLLLTLSPEEFTEFIAHRV